MTGTKLLSLLQDAETIIITSHISPDPDAVASVLLLSTALSLGFSNKTVMPILEEMPENLSYVHGFSQLKGENIAEALKKYKPNLFIVVDAVNFDRVSRRDGETVRQWLKDNSLTKVAIIDHHEDEDKDESDYYFNRRSPATTLDIYQLCFREMALEKPDGYAETALLGIYADTGGLAYGNGHYRETFDVVSSLLDDGASIEKTRFALETYNIDVLHAAGELAVNLNQEKGYNYSFMRDEYVAEWKNDGKSLQDLHLGCKVFVDNYIRNARGAEWGFIVYRDPLEDDDIYSISLRSISGVRDVSAIARKLGGGGHKPAAGGRFKAANIEDAISKVKTVISASE